MFEVCCWLPLFNSLSLSLSLSPFLSSVFLGTATPLTISQPSPAIKIEPTVSTMTTKPTTSYSQSSVGGSKSASSTFGGTPTSSKFESKPTKV